MGDNRKYVDMLLSEGKEFAPKNEPDMIAINHIEFDNEGYTHKYENHYIVLNSDTIFSTASTDGKKNRREEPWNLVIQNDVNISLMNGIFEEDNTNYRLYFRKTYTTVLSKHFSKYHCFKSYPVKVDCPKKFHMDIIHRAGLSFPVVVFSNVTRSISIDSSIDEIKDYLEYLLFEEDNEDIIYNSINDRFDYSVIEETHHENMIQRPLIPEEKIPTLTDEDFVNEMKEKVDIGALSKKADKLLEKISS